MILCIAGGDGSFIYFLQDLVQFQIDISQAPICVLPYGTGNDLSRVLGWGIQPKPIWQIDLLTLAKEIVQCEEKDFNVWDVQIYFHNQDKKGEIWKINQKNKKKESLGNETFKRCMSNYFSIGEESRAGLGFDKKRTKVVCCNKFIYFCEGLKKLCSCQCRSQAGKTLKIKETIEYVSTEDKQGTNKILFASSKNMECDQYLNGNPVSFVITNINSMCDGQQMWKGGKNRQIGLCDTFGKVLDPSKMKFNDDAMFDDGLVEIEIVNSLLHMGLGATNRIAQEKGPIQIQFKEFDKKDLYTYMQIDGEYFKIKNPSHIIFKLSDTLKNIKVLVNQSSE